METSKFNVKFYLADPDAVKLEDVVPVFHSWIQTRAMPDHMLIDVADYAHVPQGPGVVLVAHEANIYLDQLDGRTGLTYSRKQPLDGSLTEQLALAFGSTLQLCSMLDESLGGVRFKTDEANLRINDRLYAPNTPATFAAVKGEIESIARRLFGNGVKLEQRGNPKQLFEIAIQSVAATDLPTLMQRIGVSHPAGI